MTTRLVSKVLSTTVLAIAIPLYAGVGHAQMTPRPTFLAEQPADQSLLSFYYNEPVRNAAGEVVGDVNDLLIDKSGRIVNVVLGVGGVLGIGERQVVIPFSDLSIVTDSAGKRVITAPLTLETLKAAPEFKPREKSVMLRMKEKASELTQEATKKIEEMRKGETK